MKKSIRNTTLESFGLGTVMQVFDQCRKPILVDELVDQIFGNAENRGAMVISGAGGIVGSGKLMQFSARLKDFGVPVIALDLPGAADG